jgi:assimilatory nitrate reductase catalytic subunit
MKVVVIDPRRTATCDIADRHLALAPGSDGGLFVGLLNAIAEGRLTAIFATAQALAAARGWDSQVANSAGCREQVAGSIAIYRRAAGDHALHHGDQSVRQRQRQM